MKATQSALWALCWSLTVTTTGARGQTEKPIAAEGHDASPTTAAQQEPAPPEDPPAVTVNNVIIHSSTVEKTVQEVVRQQTGGQTVPPEMLEQVRSQIAPRVIELLIDQHLMDEQVIQAKVTMTEAEFAAELEQILQGQLLRTGMSRAEFAQQVQQEMGMPEEQYLAERAADKDFRQAMLQARLLQIKFPEEVGVPDDALKTRYEADKEQLYTRQAKVRASHILISADEQTSAEDKASAKKRAEGLLEELKKPEADFAALAKEHSGCPSKEQGGDLGFFANDGSMVAPFADAAFALQPGEISGVVETPFGFHIIKLTERKETHTVSFEEAVPFISHQMRTEKIGALRTKYLTELRKEAKIVYPERPAPSDEPAQPPTKGEGTGS